MGRYRDDKETITGDALPPTLILHMAVDAGAVAVHVLIACPTARVWVDVVRKDSVAFDADCVTALIVAGSAVDNLPACNAPMEVR